MKVNGLDQLAKKLNNLAQNAKALDGKNTVPLTELLTPAFVSDHTNFSNVDEMFEASGFKIETTEDFKAIPDDQWDQFIRSISSFPDWQAMLSEASKAWTVKKLGF